jgi:hypothetical protein
MVEQFIEYNNKKYPVIEPNIKTWSEVMKFRNILDEGELFIKVIELTTGLTRDQILEAEASQVQETGEKVLQFISQANKQVVREFNHKGKDYQFLDIHNLSFGQFVDIDTFLSKDENYRIQNLNELAAYLFIEKGTKYGEKPMEPRKEEFADLPMKYLEGAVFFLLSSARISDALTKIYSQSTSLKVMMKTKIISLLIGDGIKRSAHSVRTKYGYLIMLLTYPLFSASIIFLTLWILIRNKKG